MDFRITLSLPTNKLRYLSFGDKVGHDGGVAELGGQVDAAAALAVDQRRVCAVFHELHHHG